MKKFLPVLSLVAMISLGSNASNAMTVADFDQKSSAQKGVTLGKLLDGLYRYYQANEMEDKAECMAELYKSSTVSGETPRLMNMIVLELHRARSSDPTRHNVEDIIFTVVEKNCGG